MCEKIDKLAKAAGLVSDPTMRSAIVSLENEIADLESEIQANKQVLEHYEQLVKQEEEAHKVDLDVHEKFIENLPEAINNERDKFNMLHQYMTTIESSDEFLLNKLHRQINDRVSGFKSQLNPINKNIKSIANQLPALRELADKCMELRKLVN